MVLMDHIPGGNQKKAGMILDLQLFGGWFKKTKDLPHVVFFFYGDESHGIESVKNHQLNKQKWLKEKVQPMLMKLAQLP